MFASLWRTVHQYCSMSFLAQELGCHFGKPFNSNYTVCMVIKAQTWAIRSIFEQIYIWYWVSASARRVAFPLSFCDSDFDFAIKCPDEEASITAYTISCSIAVATESSSLSLSPRRILHWFDERFCKATLCYRLVARYAVRFDSWLQE